MAAWFPHRPPLDLMKSTASLLLSENENTSIAALLPRLWRLCQRAPGLLCWNGPTIGVGAEERDELPKGNIAQLEEKRASG